MVPTALVESQIADARALIHALDEAGIAVDVALWLFEPEREAWRLVLASDELTRLGTKAAYARVDAVLEQLTLEHLRLWDISIRRDDSPVVRALKSLEARVPGIAERRLQGNVLDGVYLDDAYIFRVRSSGTAAARLSGGT